MAKTTWLNERWYTYRELWSSGRGRWQYVLLSSNKEDVKSYFDSLSERHSYSEHFRGIEYKPVKNNRLTQDALNKVITDAKITIESCKYRLTRASAMISCAEKDLQEKYYRIPRDKKCMSCKGTGKSKTWEGNKVNCCYCDGKGKVKGE